MSIMRFLLDSGGAFLSSGQIFANAVRTGQSGLPKPPPPTVYTPPKSSTTTKKGSSTTTKKGSSTSRASRSSGGGGSSGGIKKSNDKAQVAALEELLSEGFAKARDQRIDNIQTAYSKGDQILLDGYDTRLKTLLDLREDNEIAEGASSWANLGNRAREASDILTEIATQGGGETDQLQANLIAARNWAANQMEVNRAYHDSVGSSNNAITDLNADTRSARYNLANQMLSDTEQAHATYRNQMAETATQLGNIYANPYSDSHKTDTASMWKRMTDSATDVWENPGVSEDVTEWKGTFREKQARLNNAMLEGATLPAIGAAKRPEGSTLRQEDFAPAMPAAARQPRWNLGVLPADQRNAQKPEKAQEPLLPKWSNG